MKNEKLIANCLKTKAGRDALWNIGFKPAIKEWSKNVFSKWDRNHQERWMNVAFGTEWKNGLI